MTDASLALYVHMPWCVRKCPYCDFNSHQLKSAQPDAAYIETLIRDFRLEAPRVKDRRIDTVFFGGGTPSLFPPEHFARLLDALRQQIAFASDVEITLEANPGTIERGRFSGYKDAGINRVSLGAQTFDARALKALGRIHSAEDTQRAVEELRAAKLDNFNLDLMYALPEQTCDQAQNDVKKAIALKPAHISYYQLTLEPGTVFAAHPPPLPDEDACAAMLEESRALLSSAGFAQYEVSAYARAGAQCRHNLNYWTFGDYLGIGAGAHGKLTFAAAGSVVRTTQLREPRRYLTAPDTALAQRAVSPEDLPFEFMLNALRLTAGFEVETFVSRTGLAWEAVAPTVRAALDVGLLLRTAQGYRPSARGLRFLNDLLLGFLPETPKNSGASALSMATPEVAALR